MGFLAFTTFDLVNNLVGILYIIFNVFLYTVVVFLVNGKINEWMNEWMYEFHILKSFYNTKKYVITCLYILTQSLNNWIAFKNLLNAL